LSQGVLKRDPKNAEAKLALGQGLAAKGDWPKAAVALGEAAKGMPRSVSAHYALGLALLNVGRPKPAAEAFLEALDIDDSDPKLHLQLGIAYYLAREKALVPYARKEYQHCLDRHPSGEDGSLAWYHIALLADDAGKTDEAMADYQNALKLDPKN